MNVTLTSDDLDTADNKGTVILVTGTDDDGNRVTFAGDHRPMAWALEIVETVGEIQVDVDAWQILSTEKGS